MKTKAQKQASITKGEDLLSKSEAVVLFDFSNIRTADLRFLRQELKNAGSPLFVMKKRLLGIALKKQNVVFDVDQFKTSVGAVFASSFEAASASVYKFFKQLQKEKKIDAPKILGGVDLKAKVLLPSADILAIGSLPPREALLAQLAAMLAAPVRSLLYVLKTKSERSS